MPAEFKVFWPHWNINLSEETVISKAIKTKNMKINEKKHMPLLCPSPLLHRLGHCKQALGGSRLEEERLGSPIHHTAEKDVVRLLIGYILYIIHIKYNLFNCLSVCCNNLQCTWCSFFNFSSTVSSSL